MRVSLIYFLKNHLIILFSAVFLASLFLIIGDLKAQEKCYTDWLEVSRQYQSGGLGIGGVSETEFSRYVNVGVSNSGSGYVVTYQREEKGCPVKDVGGKLIIDPSLVQRPACYGPWYSAGVIGSGGISAENCASSVPAASEQVRYAVNTIEPHCTFSTSRRDKALCPLFNDTIKFFSDKEQAEELGKFTVTWSSNGENSPEVECTLSGKDPEKGINFSEPTRDGRRTYQFVQRGIYNFKFSCNGILDNAKSLNRGTIERTLTVFAGNIPPKPKVDIKVEPVTIKKGESATLFWTSENAIAVSISQNVGIVGKTGSIKVSPSVTTRYAITGSGEFAELGLARASVSLRVVASDAVKVETAPDITVPEDRPVDATPEVKPEIGLMINGQKGTMTTGVPVNLSISWKANQYCIAYGSWLGIKTKSATEDRTITKAGNYNYKLYCPGIGMEEVIVRAVGSGGTGGVMLPVAEAGVSLDGKNFLKSIHITKGKKTHLWLSAGNDVTGDKRASRDSAGGWSSGLSNGGRCDWNYDLNRGIPTFDVGIANPKNAKDCLVDLGEVVFNDQPGVYTYGVLRLVQADGKVSNTASINIAIVPPPPPDTAPIIDFKVNGKDKDILLGAPAEYDLTWDVKNSDTCSASGSWSGDKFSSGSQKFVASEKREFNYILICTGKLGTSVKNISVKVAELPVCDFSALPMTLSKSVFDRQSALTWKCQFANTCAISPSIGVSVGTFGTARVSPDATTNYTLSCENLEGNSSFDQLIQVR